MVRSSLSSSPGVAIAVAVAMLGLAGCTAKSDEPATVIELSDGTQLELAEGGAISGVVVDEAIRPLAGVNVTVLGADLTVTTDAGGLFAVPDLDPGLYTLSVAATGYIATQTTAEVILGETAKVRIVLPIDTTPQPYHQSYKFDWYDDSGIVIVDFAVDLFTRDLSPVNETLPPLCDRCWFEFTSDMPVDTFVVEATWEDTVEPVHKESEYYWSLYGLTVDEYQSDYFYNPGRAEFAAGNLGNETVFGINLAAEEEWVTFQQHAQLFVTLFYLAPPPEGWSIIAGDT